MSFHSSQLRVRDLQGALEVEKAAHSELILKSESMSKQIRCLFFTMNETSKLQFLTHTVQEGVGYCGKRLSEGLRCSICSS